MIVKCKCGWYYETEHASKQSLMVELCHYCLSEVKEDRTTKKLKENDLWGKEKLKKEANRR